jgi:hypothetical protein
VPGHEHYRLAARGPLDLGDYPCDPVAVKPAGRLVEHQQVRIVDESLGDQRALRVAA